MSEDGRDCPAIEHGLLAALRVADAGQAPIPALPVGAVEEGGLGGSPPGRGRAGMPGGGGPPIKQDFAVVRDARGTGGRVQRTWLVVAGPGSASYHRLGIAQFASAAGDALVALSLAGSLFVSVPSADARGNVLLYLAITMAPFAVVAPVLGPFLDRRVGMQRFVLAFAGFGRAGIALVAAPATDSILLYPAAFGLLVLSRAHNIARSGVVGSVTASTEELLAANARLSRLAVVGGAVGALPGALLLRVLGSGAVLVAAAGVFAVAGLVSLTLPGRRRRGDAPAADAAPVQVALLADHRTRLGLLAMAGHRAFVGLLLFVLAFALQRTGANAAGYASVVVAAGAGTFLGSLIGPRLPRALRVEPVLILTYAIGFAGCWFGLRQSFGITAAAIVAGAAGLASSLAKAGFDTLLQTRVPPGGQGRAFSRAETVLQLAWVGGALLPVAIAVDAHTGLVAAAWGYGAGGILYVGAVVAGLLARGRERRRMDRVP